MLKKKCNIIILIIAALVLGAFTITIFATKTKKIKQFNKHIHVEIARVTNEVLEKNINVIGTTRAVQGINITSEIPGKVVAIKFISGSKVKAGDILVEFDKTEDLAHISYYKAQYNYFEKKLAKYSILNAKHYVSNFSIDNIKNKMQMAQAQIELANAKMQKKIIKADFDGYVGICNVSIGQYIKPGDVITTLQNNDKLLVDFFISQKHYQDLMFDNSKINEVYLTSSHNNSIKAAVYATDPVFDKETQTIHMVAIIDSNNNKLLPGITVDIRIPQATAQKQLAVPIQSLVYTPEGVSVYAIKNNKVAASMVKVVSMTNQKAIVESDLQSGDVIMLSGQNRVEQGSEVYY